MLPIRGPGKGVPYAMIQDVMIFRKYGFIYNKIVTMVDLSKYHTIQYGGFMDV